jgi:hypothetical protein
MRYCLLLLLFHSIIGIAQQNTIRIKRETIGSCGTSSFTSSLKVHSTVGQASIVSNETDSDYLQLSQGFQKAASTKWKLDDWSITVFPNPNAGVFSFTTTLPASHSFDFEIMDARGRIIYRNKGTGDSTINVELKTVLDGYYFLNVRTTYSSSTFKLAIFQ